MHRYIRFNLFFNLSCLYSYRSHSLLMVSVRLHLRNIKQFCNWYGIKIKNCWIKCNKDEQPSYASTNLLYMRNVFAKNGHFSSSSLYLTLSGWWALSFPYIIGFAKFILCCFEWFSSHMYYYFYETHLMGKAIQMLRTFSSISYILDVMLLTWVITFFKAS